MDNRRWAQLFGFEFINIVRITPQARRIVADLVRRARAFAPTGRCTCQDFNGRRCSGPECESFRRRVMCGEACGVDCCNRMFAQDWGIVELRLSALDGVGKVTVAGVDIPADTYICQVVGVMRAGLVPANTRFCFRVEARTARPLYIDCTTTGNMSRFLVHSESPNCEAETWYVDDTIIIVIRSIVRIRNGEVLYIRYPQLCEGYDQYEFGVVQFDNENRCRPNRVLCNAAALASTPLQDISNVMGGATSLAYQGLRRIAPPIFLDQEAASALSERPGNPSDASRLPSPPQPSATQRPSTNSNGSRPPTPQRPRTSSNTSGPPTPPQRPSNQRRSDN